MRWLTLIVALSLGAGALAAETFEGFDDPAMDARYRALIHSLRCLQCQNQSIAESGADVAGDLRRQVRDRMVEGWSDKQITDYFVSRYGDFVTYRPPFKPSTWLLWAAPGLLLVGGGFVFARIVRARMQQPLDEDLL